jgi:formate hydrogenlyase subunit 3/multisubunit Na+/H+ antiporter MnhD subunit
LGALVPAGIDRLLGVYLLVRAVFGIFSWPGAEGMRSLLLLVGAAGAIGGVLGAMVQTDLRKMLAFIGVGQSGLVLMAVAGGSAAGMSGAVLQGLVAAVAVSLLFLCAGSIERRTGTTELARLGGLGRRMPMTFLAMFVAGLSAAGLPLLAGFAPRWLTCVALLDSALAPGDSPYGRFFGLVCTFGFVAVLASGLLTLAAFARLFRAVFTGPVPGCCQAARPAGPAVRFAEHGMALLLLASGILPATLLGPNGLIGRVAADAGASGLGVSRVSLAPLAGGFWNPPLVGALLLAAVCAGGVILALSRISRSRTVPPFTALVAAGGDLRGVAYPAPDFNDVAGEAPMLRLVSGLSLLRPCDWGLWAGRLATVPGWILALFFTGWFGLLLALLAGAAAVAAGAAVIAGLPWPLWAPRAVAGTGLGMFVAGALGAAFVRRPRAAASGLWVAFAGLALLSLAGAVRAGRAAETSTAAAYAREGRVIGARIERADLQARLRAVRDDIPLSGSGTVPAEADLEKRIAFLDKGIPAEGRTLEAQKRQARFFGYGKALLALGYALSMVCGALACLLLRLWAGAVERQTGGGSAGGSGGQPEAGGLWLRMPVASGCAAVGGLAMAWAPPLAGFWALLAVLGGLLISRQVQLAGAAAIGAMAVTWAVARLLGSQLFGPMPEGVIRSRGVRGVLLGLLLLVLAVACFAAGPLVARALPGLAAPLVSLLRG